MDILVIGGGPGGYVAAIMAARRGARVTLIEKDALGGTCLNLGCIPTKAILHSANMFHEAKSFAQLGIVIDPPQLDFAALMKRKDNITAQLRRGVGFLLEKAGVIVVRGEARFLSRHEVAVRTATEEIKLAAQHVIIATGSAPSDLPFAKCNGKALINSNHALQLTHLPKSLAIIGGGVIGCEFAQAYARLGAKVTMLEQFPVLLSTMDAEQSALIQRTLKAEGVHVHVSCSVDEVLDNGDSVTVRFTKDGAQETVEAEKLLIAAGRRPVTADLNAQAANIALNGKGAIQIDAMCRTSVEGIYAIGDVTGGVQLAHVASHQAAIAVNNLFGAQQEFDERLIPYCVYTSPELASIGYTEARAKAAGLEVKTGVFPAAANGRTMIEGERAGFSKLLVSRDDNTVLGLHLAGHHVTEMISPFASVIKFEATTEDVADLIFAHPTISEMIFESILDTEKQAIHKA